MGWRRWEKGRATRCRTTWGSMRFREVPFVFLVSCTRWFLSKSPPARPPQRCLEDGLATVRSPRWNADSAATVPKRRLRARCSVRGRKRRRRTSCSERRSRRKRSERKRRPRAKPSHVKEQRHVRRGMLFQAAYASTSALCL